MNLDVNFPRADDEDLVLPQAEAFPPLATEAPAGTIPQDEFASEANVAPQQRKRREPKELPVDRTQELRSTDLAQWNDEYIGNMDHANKSKLQHKSTTVAKQNAAFWVFGAGIGGVGAGIGASQTKGPLAHLFAGEALMQALTGTPIAGRKRSRSEDEGGETGSEARKMKMRETGEEVGRAQGFNLDDDDTVALPGSAVNSPVLEPDVNTHVLQAIEMGRHAQPSLEDTSQFPWNRSASLRGSRQESIARGQGFLSSVGGFATSGGRTSSLPAIGGPGSMDRRASRITSASPLFGRGPAHYSDLEIPQSDDNEFLGGPSTSIAGDDFQLYGPAAGVDTQTAAQSQWLRTTLDTESNNFLEFIKTEISNRAATAQEAGDELTARISAPDSVFFEEVLPPTQNTNIVAAQGFHHVLALATKGLIRVDQQEHYGPIKLGLAAGL